jgi:hypothetical protein
MRRSTALAVAALAALAPRAGWAEDVAASPAAAAPEATATPAEAAPAPAPAPAATTPAATTPAEREEARDAASVGLPLPGPGAALPAAYAPAPAPAPAPASPATGLRRRPLPLLGVSLGGGFPDLANLNLLVRPAPWFRLYGGPSWSSVSWGAQAGAVLAPWSWYVTPTLSLQAGKLFGTSLTRFVKSDSKSAQDVKPLLGNVDYQYLAGDLGVELGSPRGFSFYLRLGLSLVSIRANGTATHTADDGTRVTIRDPSVTAWLPSAKLGFQYWF